MTTFAMLSIECNLLGFSFAKACLVLSSLMLINPLPPLLLAPYSRNAIVDKNARIGANVVIENKDVSLRAMGSSCLARAEHKINGTKTTQRRK